MRVVQLLPELNEGGVERGVVELNRELVKRKIESIVISNGGKLVPQIQKDGGLHVKVNVCSKNLFTAPFRISKLYKAIKKLHPDILHVRSRVPAWMVYFANKFLHVKVVSTVHGFNSVNFYSSIMTKADKTICVSEAIKIYIQKHYKVDDEKISIIPRGVDMGTFNSKNIDSHFIEEFKTKYSLQNATTITLVGRVTQLKDIESFIKAIALLKKQIPNIKALVVGGVREDKREYFCSLQSLCESLHVKDDVIFTGSQAKVAEIYALSDVVVSSSKKPESFGRSVAEAIALNTPVVATEHGGVKDIIRDGENGYLAPLQNPTMLAQLILKAKNLKFDGFCYIQNNFSLQQMVEKTVILYKSLTPPLILMYHSIDDTPLKRLKGIRVSKKMFEKQIAFLKESGYTSFTLSELVEKKDELPYKSVVITFDDGYKDNLTNALPILQKYNFKATLFLVENREDNDWAVFRKEKNRGIVDKIPKLSDEDVKTLLDSKLIEIGAHTLNHKNFTTLSYEEKIEEIQQSKEALQCKFSFTCKSFSYPFGIYAKNDEQIVKNLGFLCAVTTEQRATNFQKDSLFLLPRLAIKNSFSSFLKRIKSQ